MATTMMHDDDLLRLDDLSEDSLVAAEDCAVAGIQFGIPNATHPKPSKL